jgi:hypothetical protein
MANSLWDMLHTRTDPACPDWSKLSDRAFERAWRALVKDGDTLQDVATIAAGGRSPREVEEAAIRALPRRRPSGALVGPA